jgi:hypothetical protein
VIILIDQKEYAVGLNWFAVSTIAEVEQFQREMEMNHGVLKMSKEASVQSTVALCGPEYDGQLSLAGMLAYAYENLLYVLATEYKDANGQPLFYLCAIKNHAVTVDGDVMGTRETIQPLFAQNYADITADIDPSSMTCYGTGVDDALFPGVNLVEAHQVLDQALRYASQCTIKQLGKKGLSKASIIMVVLLSLGAGYFIYTFFLAPPPPPPPPPPKAVAPVTAAPVIIKRDPYEEFMNIFKKTLSQQPRVTAVPSIVAGIKQSPMAYEGWQVATITFAGDKPDILTMHLVRAPFANVEDLMALNDKGYFTHLEVDLPVATAIVDLPFVGADISYIADSIISTLSKTGSPHYYELISALQLNNIPYNAGAPEKNDFFSQITLKISGNGLWSLLALVNVLTPFETLAVKNIAITIQNGDYNWTIEGVIYG